MLIPITCGAFLFVPSGAAGTTPMTVQDFNNEIVVPQPQPETTVREIVMDASLRYGVSFNELWSTMDCETQHTFDPKIQSKARYNFSDASRGIVKGEQEKSFGLAQIHLPDHHDVSYASATDAYFSADFMAKNWTKHKSWWSCWNNNN